MLLGTTPKIGFFLNRPFWCQKHRYRPKKRGYFWPKFLIVKRSPWPDPVSNSGKLSLQRFGTVFPLVDKQRIDPIDCDAGFCFDQMNDLHRMIAVAFVEQPDAVISRMLHQRLPALRNAAACTAVDGKRKKRRPISLEIPVNDADLLPPVFMRIDQIGLVSGCDHPTA
jgi:hypothetical protein